VSEQEWTCQSMVFYGRKEKEAKEEKKKKKEKEKNKKKLQVSVDQRKASIHLRDFHIGVLSGIEKKIVKRLRHILRKKY
jgi:hypothetical protein